jgi:hypothetical protein
MKIKQIAVAAGEVADEVYALTDDDQIYAISAFRSETWAKLPSLLKQIRLEQDESSCSS